MLYGEELLKSIQKRCRIQPGMLVNSVNPSNGIKKLALVVGYLQAVSLTETTKKPRSTSSTSASLLMARQTS